MTGIAGNFLRTQSTIAIQTNSTVQQNAISNDEKTFVEGTGRTPGDATGIGLNPATIDASITVASIGYNC